MKKILILLISVILLLSSCSVIEEGNEGNETTVTTDPPYVPTPEEVWGIEVPETALFELPYPNEEFLAIQNRYTDEQLEEIADYFWDVNLETFSQRYPVEYIRKTYNGRYIAVPYISVENKEWLCLFWDQNGKPSSFSTTKSFPTVLLIDFLSIKDGASITQIREIFNNRNSNMAFPSSHFQDHEGNLCTKSRHSTSDGFCVEIHYKLKEGADPSQYTDDDMLVYDIVVEEY